MGAFCEIEEYKYKCIEIKYGAQSCLVIWGEFQTVGSEEVDLGCVLDPCPCLQVKASLVVVRLDMVKVFCKRKSFHLL